MTIEEAAKELDEFLNDCPSVQAVGVGTNDGKPTLFVYTSTQDTDSKILNQLAGWPIVIRYIGKVVIGDMVIENK